MQPPKITVPFLLIAITLLSCTSMTQASEDPQRTIRVMGQGQVSSTPDVGVLRFAVENTAATAEAASRANAEATDKVVKAVRGSLDEDAGDELSTTGYNLNPQYDSSRRPPGQGPRIVGYIARNSVVVRVHDLDAVGSLLDAAIAAGANRANDLHFELEDRGPALQKALAIAGTEARAQAESIASALGVRLGPVLSANASPSGGTPIYRKEGMMMARSEAVATPVSPGDVDVSATLEVVYSIVD